MNKLEHVIRIIIVPLIVSMLIGVVFTIDTSPMLASSSVNITIEDDDDDAREFGNGTFSATTLGASAAADSGSSLYSCGGTRFKLDIPQGATITEANVYLAGISESANNDPQLYFYADDVDNSPNFSDNASVIGRTRTTANIYLAQVNYFSDTEFHAYPDISTVVQEIVDRPGWQSGNYITILYIAKITATVGTVIWQDYGSTNKPYLVVSYNYAVVNNSGSSSVTGGYATVSGNVTGSSVNGTIEVNYGLTDGSDNYTAWDSHKTLAANQGDGTFSGFINGLSANTTYYFNFSDNYSGKRTFSSTANLTTTAVSLPSGTTSEVTNYSDTWAVLPGTLVDAGGENCTIGFQWGLLSGGVFTDNVTVSENATVGDFSANITTEAATGYIFRGFWENTAGIAYSENGTLAPTLDTLVASNIEETTATISGNITNTGGENADYRGFVWGLSSLGDPGDTAPSATSYTSYNTTSGSYSTGVFSYNMTGLSGGVTYYVRSVAHNSAGWSYGDEISFLTKPSQPSGLTASAGKIIMQSLLPIAIALAGVIVVFFFKGNWVVLLTTVVFVIASIVLVNALINAA